MVPAALDKHKQKTETIYRYKNTPKNYERTRDTETTE